MICYIRLQLHLEIHYGNDSFMIDSSVFMLTFVYKNVKGVSPLWASESLCKVMRATIKRFSKS